MRRREQRAEKREAQSFRKERDERVTGGQAERGVRKRGMLTSSSLCDFVSALLFFFHVSLGSVVLLFPSLTSAVTHTHTHRIHRHVKGDAS